MCQSTQVPFQPCAQLSAIVAISPPQPPLHTRKRRKGPTPTAPHPQQGQQNSRATRGERPSWDRKVTPSLFPLPKQGLQPSWVKEPPRQQGRYPSGVQWNASLTAGLTSQVSLAAFAGSSLTANGSPGWGAKSLLFGSLNTAKCWTECSARQPCPRLLKPQLGSLSP